MSYTTPKKIQGYYMGLDFDNSDYMTKAEIRNWIAEFAAKINTSIKRKYNLPISDSDDLTILQMLNEKFVVGKIDGIMRVSTTDEDKKYLRNRNCTKEANDVLKDIMDGTLQLNTSPKSLAPIGYNKGNYDSN